MHNIRSLIFALCTLCLAIKTTAGIPVVERVQADSMRTQQVVYEGRVCPLNTPALVFTKALTGQRTFQGLSAEQVMLSWALYPEEWKDVRMVQVKDSKVRRLLGIEGDYARFADFFDDEGNYLLIPDQHPDIDKRLTLVALLTKGELFTPLSPDQKPLSPIRLRMELLFNAVPWNFVPLVLFLLLAPLLFLPQTKKHTTLIITATISMLLVHLAVNT